MATVSEIALPHDPYYPIDDMFGCLERYLNHGIEPGSFLTAVLSNDLKGAVMRADATNLHRLDQIVGYIYHHLPAHAWGSPTQLEIWKRIVKDHKAKMAREASLGELTAEAQKLSLGY